MNDLVHKLTLTRACKIFLLKMFTSFRKATEQLAGKPNAVPGEEKFGMTLPYKLIIFTAGDSCRFVEWLKKMCSDSLSKQQQNRRLFLRTATAAKQRQNTLHVEDSEKSNSNLIIITNQSSCLQTMLSVKMKQAPEKEMWKTTDACFYFKKNQKRPSSSISSAPCYWLHLRRQCECVLAQTWLLIHDYPRRKKDEGQKL
jgi:hypothetical protein